MVIIAIVQTTKYSSKLLRNFLIVKVISPLNLIHAAEYYCEKHLMMDVRNRLALRQCRAVAFIYTNAYRGIIYD